MEADTLLLGDWGRWIRDPLDLLRAGFLIGALVYAALGRTTSISLFAAFLVLLFVRWLDLPRPYDFALIVAMFLIAWGTALDLYGLWYYYKKIVHTIAPLCYSPAIYLALVRAEVLPPLHDIRESHHRIGIWLITVLIGTGISAGYEVIEWASDALLGTSLAPSERDMATDIIAGFVGSCGGGALLVLWAARGWATTRRVSPEVVEQRT